MEADKKNEKQTTKSKSKSHPMKETARRYIIQCCMQKSCRKT